MKETKKRKLEKIRKILDERTQKDTQEFSNPKSRSLNQWLMIVNHGLTPMEKIRNHRELSAIFRIFNFTKDAAETRYEGCFRRIVFYKYKGGYKNGKNK